MSANLVEIELFYLLIITFACGASIGWAVTTAIYKG